MEKIFYIIVAMVMILTEVPIVNVKTADKETIQDVNEDYGQSKVRTVKHTFGSFWHCHF